MVTSFAMIVLTFGLNSGVSGGFFVSHLDLSPHYAGILMALGSTIGNCFFVAAPQIVKLVATQEVRISFSTLKIQARWDILIEFPSCDYTDILF